jgi:hypothetical protein
MKITINGQEVKQGDDYEGSYRSDVEIELTNDIENDDQIEIYVDGNIFYINKEVLVESVKMLEFELKNR